MAHYPVPEGQSHRFQLAVAAYFGLDPDRVAGIDVSYTGGLPYAEVDARLMMPSALAIEMFNAAAAEPEPEGVVLADEDVQVDVFTKGLPSSAPGNNPVVQVTHLPTGKVVRCDKTRSMLQNKAYALAALEEMLNA